jgi:ATP-binding cassette subfamily F protein 3
MAFPKAERAGNIVLRAEGLTKAYDKPLFADLSLEIGDGERWGIAGPNAVGKTTLLKCLVGEVACDGGAVHWAERAKIAYYDQHLAQLEDDAEVMEAIRVPGKEMNEQQRRSLLARFGITGDMAFQPVRSLSGGERSRVALAWLAATDANVLVLDEPTNHLDLWARDALERALVDYGGTVLLVSHDRYFLNRVVDHLIVMDANRTRVVIGNYDAYLAAEAARPASTEEANPRATKPRARDDGDGAPRRKRRFPYRKVEDLEAEILERETRIEDYQVQLSTEAVVRSGERTRELREALESEQSALAELYAHWDEAVELN